MLALYKMVEMGILAKLGFLLTILTGRVHFIFEVFTQGTESLAPSRKNHRNVAKKCIFCLMISESLTNELTYVVLAVDTQRMPRLGFY